MDVGELQGLLLPDPDKPVTYDSLIEQYTPRAREACVEKGWPEEQATMLASIWADMDMEILQTMLIQSPEKTVKELLLDMAADMAVWKKAAQEG